MNAATRQIDSLFQEMRTIEKRGNPTPADKLRHSALLSQVACLRRANTKGPGTDFAHAEYRRKVLAQWQEIAKYPENDLSPLLNEFRDTQTAGAATITGTTQSAGGVFVPIQFLYVEIQNQLAAHDALFDSDKVSLLLTNSGSTLELPIVSDVSEFATPVAEAASDSGYSNLALVGNAENNVFSYRSGKIAVSIEFGQDAEAFVSSIENFFAGRIARGVGRDLVTGNSAGHIRGLLPSLESLGVPFTTASGSAADDGSASTGANSIGSADLHNLFSSVNSAYRNSPKCAWLMADTTLLAIASLRDKMGAQLGLVKYDGDGQPRLFGKPIYISPSLPSIAPSAQGVVIFGDLSRWITRAVPRTNYVQRFSEIPGIAEQGKVCFEAFARYGGQLLATDSSASPISYLSMFS